MSGSADPRSLTAMVFMVAFAVTSMWLTMQSLGHSAERTQLSGQIDSHRATMREQLDLASAARRSLEESISGAQESDRKAHSALQKTVHEHKEKREAADEAAIATTMAAKEEMLFRAGADVHWQESTTETDRSLGSALSGRSASTLSGRSYE